MFCVWICRPDQQGALVQADRSLLNQSGASLGEVRVRYVDLNMNKMVVQLIDSFSRGLVRAVMGRCYAPPWTLNTREPVMDNLKKSTSP